MKRLSRKRRGKSRSRVADTRQEAPKIIRRMDNLSIF